MMAQGETKKKKDSHIDTSYDVGLRGFHGSCAQRRENRYQASHMTRLAPNGGSGKEGPLTDGRVV